MLACMQVKWWIRGGDIMGLFFIFECGVNFGDVNYCTVTTTNTSRLEATVRLIKEKIEVYLL